MAFVIDASATLPWFLEDERTPFTDSLLEAVDRIEYWAPAVWCLEIPNALLIAERRDLSMYDAAYLELALRHEFGLITLDRALAQAAIAEGVPLEAPGRSGAAQRRRRYNI
jgi:predicted nucleic acid-binding protein